MKRIIGIILILPIILIFSIELIVELVEPFISHNVGGMIMVILIGLAFLGMYLTYD